MKNCSLAFGVFMVVWSLLFVGIWMSLFSLNGVVSFISFFILLFIYDKTSEKMNSWFFE